MSKILTKLSIIQQGDNWLNSVSGCYLPAPVGFLVTSI